MRFHHLTARRQAGEARSALSLLITWRNKRIRATTLMWELLSYRGWLPRFPMPPLPKAPQDWRTTFAIQFVAATIRAMPINQKQWRREQLRRRLRGRIGRTILYMIVMGVVCWWVAIQALWLTKLNLKPAMFLNIPKYAFGVGLAIGLSTSMSISVREAIALLGSLVMGVVVLFFFGLGLGVLGMIFGLSEDGADWVLNITFWGGLILFGALLVYGAGLWLLDKLRPDSAPRQASARPDR
jgi:hypothetical protein